MKKNKIPFKDQCQKVTEVINLFQIITISELANCLMRHESRLNVLVNHHIPGINRVRIFSYRKAQYVYFIGEFNDHIKNLIIKKYKKIPYVEREAG